MVGRCFKPGCSAAFHYLEDGSLFRLEPDAVARSSDRSEYSWLCNSCAALKTNRQPDGREYIVLPAQNKRL